MKNSEKEDREANEQPEKENEDNKEEELPGYPLYPDDEDIYTRGEEMSEIDPDDLSSIKPANEKDFNDELTGDDLDIPGSELDDAEEKIGSEDEENNYYSLGDDNNEDDSQD